MGQKNIAADIEDLKSVIAEEEIIFIFSVLYYCQIPEALLESCLPVDGKSLSIEQKINLRKVCEKFDINIISDQDGGIEIYLNNESLIATWKKPLISLRKDLKQREKSKQYYNEIHFSWWIMNEEKNE